tara:strand:- start:329 stop:1393 length:1065 start_codon:yes stop_codon:yes gene_type:complete
MLNKKFLKKDLFTIETNIDFKWINFLLNKDIEDLANKYFLGKILSLRKINKKSHTSNIYLLETQKGEYILRSSELKLHNKNEFLCLLSNKLKNTKFISPLKNHKGFYATKLGNLSWITYPKIEGDIFNGSNCSIYKLISYGIEFFKELEQIEVFNPEESKKILGVNLIDKKKLKSLPKVLLNNKKIDKLRKLNFIKTSTANYLLENKSLIRKLFYKLDSIQFSKINLVHNDLQHANIIINNDFINFIDLEDILWSNKEVAFCHFLFKNLRHMIYSNILLLDKEFPESLEKIMSIIYNSDIGIYSTKQFFNYSMVKIFSDLTLITDSYYLNNDTKFMYDFEKKIHNLFELIYLFY